mmetsp:Transcript_88028/g.247410  ORF Transcript_88028/g.247410 Transcript_88028/m.247410 type:complete len:292 (+) Transcript_88028:272-1147(+)
MARQGLPEAAHVLLVHLVSGDVQRFACTKLCFELGNVVPRLSCLLVLEFIPAQVHGYEIEDPELRYDSRGGMPNGLAVMEIRAEDLVLIGLRQVSETVQMPKLQRIPVKAPQRIVEVPLPRLLHQAAAFLAPRTRLRFCDLKDTRAVPQPSLPWRWILRVHLDVQDFEGRHVRMVLALRLRELFRTQHRQRGAQRGQIPKLVVRGFRLARKPPLILIILRRAIPRAPIHEVPTFRWRQDQRPTRLCGRRDEVLESHPHIVEAASVCFERHVPPREVRFFLDGPVRGVPESQ